MIAQVIKGESPTLLHADKANELIDAINCFLGLTVTPEGSGKLVVNGDKAVLDLKLVGKLVKDMIVVINGAPYYTNIVTDGRLDEI